MTLRCPQVKKVWPKKRSGVCLRAARCAAVTSQPELLSGSENACTSPRRSSKPTPRRSRAGDQIGSIERLLAPERNCHQRQLRPVGRVTGAADPGAVDLAGDQEGRDLLVGPPGDELDLVAGGALQIVLQPIKKVDVASHDDRREPELEGLAGEGGSRRPASRRPACRTGSPCGSVPGALACPPNRSLPAVFRRMLCLKMERPQASSGGW